MRCPQCRRAREAAEAAARRAQEEAPHTEAVAKGAAANGIAVDENVPQFTNNNDQAPKTADNNKKVAKANANRNRGKHGMTWTNAKISRENLVEDISEVDIASAAAKTAKVKRGVSIPNPRRLTLDESNIKGKPTKPYSLRPNPNHVVRDNNCNKGKGVKTHNGKGNGKGKK